MVRLLWAILLVALSPTFAFAQSTPPPQIHYIGFNQFKDDLDGVNAKIFDKYVKELTPIMGRYGLTLETYRVVHGDSARIGADAVTFGTAPDQESFVTFFEDPDFQALFPALVGIIENHTVVFTPEPFAPSMGDTTGPPILLAAVWLKGDRDASFSALMNMEEDTAAPRARYGVELIKRTQGVMANRGLAAEVEEVAAPDVLALWNLDDPHGYYDDPATMKFSKAAKEYIEESATLWLEPW